MINIIMSVLAFMAIVMMAVSIPIIIYLMVVTMKEEYDSRKQKLKRR